MTRSAVFDSSIWIELFRRGPLSKKCEKALRSHPIVGVPSIAVFEIYRKILRSFSEELALSSAAYLKRFTILDLTTELALLAADLSIAYKLAMADSIVLAHAVSKDALLITLDNDFVGIKDVQLIRKTT